MRNLKISTERLAQICGVSQGTVDRALNNRNGISEETKKKIIAAAIKYGYRPINENALSRHIGVIVFDLNNEYLTTLVTELESELRNEGYRATVMFSHYDREYEIECIKTLYSSGVDGIVVFSVNRGDDFVNFISSLSIPVVCVGNKVEGIPYVGIDDHAAMKALTEYVAEKDYNKLIYFSPALEYKDAFAQKLRYQGFLEGVTQNIDYLVITQIENVPKNLPKKTAIICSTDYYALKIYFSNVSADIYGFDNINMIKKYSLPIKSVDYSVKEIAKNSVKLILNKEATDVIIPYQI